MSEYVIRPFEERDAEAFCSLYSTVFEDSKSLEAFHWKYSDNPFVDEPPIFVAEAESTGELVGARPHFALELQNDAWTGLGLQPCDTMVHPDHRRRGLFQRMTLTALDYYRGRAPLLMFNFPNEMSRPGYLKLGWKIVGNVGVSFRFHDLKRTATNMFSERVGQLAGILDAPLRLLLSELDDVRTRSTLDEGRFSSGSRVEVSRSAPSSALAELPGPPGEKIRVNRDERYFEWRYENPETEYEFYEHWRDESLEAVVVTNTETSNGVEMVSIVDAMGRGHGDNSWHRLLSKITRENEDADVVRLFDGTIPRRVTRRFGFVSKTAFPLSLVADQTQLVAYPLFAADDEITRTNIFSIDNWELSLGAYDIT